MEAVEPVTWSECEGEELQQGIRLRIGHPKVSGTSCEVTAGESGRMCWADACVMIVQDVQQVAWHAKGDYLASVMPDSSSNLQVLIHQLSRRRSQNPFRRNKGLVQCVSFHPIRPYFFVATQRSIRIYNLIKQEMTKKLEANSKWISSMAIHPGGNYGHRLHGATVTREPQLRLEERPGQAQTCERCS